MKNRYSLLSLCAAFMLVLFFAGTFPACTNGGTKEGCQSDEDCKNETEKKACDKNSNKCVQCLDSKKHCKEGQICDNFVCRAGCAKDDDCKGVFKDRPNARVSCKASACVVLCDDHGDCKADEHCEGGECAAGPPPKSNLPGKYEECPKGECQEGLNCLTYKGGTVNYCWKKCSKGCDDKTEVCVEEKDFAEGHSVCMKKVEEQGGTFDYDVGTACAKELLPLRPPDVFAGTCWKPCTEKCLGDYKCVPHPHIQDKKQKFCMKPCAKESDCPKGTSCLEHKDANNDFYCFKLR